MRTAHVMLLSIVSLVALIAPTHTLRAQQSTTPKVFYACYVPSAGTVYRIKEPGLPQECYDKGPAKHTEFSWTDGGGTMRAGDAAGGDLGGTFPNPTVLKLLGRAISSTPPADGQVYVWNAASSQWIPSTPSSGSTDHSALTNLDKDDHPQYLKTDGSRAVAGSLTINGSLTVSSGNVNLAAGGKVTNLAEGSADGDAVPWQQAIKRNDAAGGDLGGSYPNPRVTALQGSAVAPTTPATGQVLTFNGSSWVPTAPAAGVSDHGTLAGLSDDDHPQYLRSDGTRALTGSLSAASNKITNLGAATTNGDAVRFEQAVKVGDVAQGDLSGDFPTLTVARLRGTTVAPATPTLGQVLTFNGVAWAPATPSTSSGGTTDHGALSGLTDDDHQQYLLANGVRSAANGFAVTSAGTVGSIPATGPGTRLMWWSARGAFRAGRVSGSQWDETDVGDFSTAFGTNTRASGQGSFAAGINSVASGGNAVAIGSGVNATGSFAAAFGANTTASGGGAVALGNGSTASGSSSLAAGSNTAASGGSSVAMGSGAAASGITSFALGHSTTADANFSVAIGTFASTNGHQGSIVFGDVSSGGQLITPTGPNQFVARAQGGFLFRTMVGSTNGAVGVGGIAGCDIQFGGDLVCSGTITGSSDASLKTDFEPMDGEDVLTKLARLRISSWRYKADPATRHVGPTAQDFRAAFGLGKNERTISMVDADGVNMLAIQALERRTRTLESENAELRARLAKLEAAVSDVRGARPR